MPAKVGSSKARPTIGTKRSGRLRSACPSRGAPRVARTAVPAIRFLRSMGDLPGRLFWSSNRHLGLSRSPPWWFAPVARSGVAAVPLDEPGQHVDEDRPLLDIERGHNAILSGQRGR